MATRARVAELLWEAWDVLGEEGVPPRIPRAGLATIEDMLILVETMARLGAWIHATPLVNPVVLALVYGLVGIAATTPSPPFRAALGIVIVASLVYVANTAAGHWHARRRATGLLRRMRDALYQ